MGLKIIVRRGGTPHSSGKLVFHKSRVIETVSRLISERVAGNNWFDATGRTVIREERNRVAKIRLMFPSGAKNSLFI